MEFKVVTYGDWKQAIEFTEELASKFEKSIEPALMAEAHYFRQKIIEGLRKQAPGGKPILPLSAETLALRKAGSKRRPPFGGTKALIHTGDLVGSINVTKATGGGAFVGVLRSAKGKKKGAPLFNVALQQETGGSTLVIKLTPKARRYLMAVYRKSNLLKKVGRGAAQAKSGAGVTVTIIRRRARPFIAPVWEAEGNDAKIGQRVLERINKRLGGKLQPVSE